MTSCQHPLTEVPKWGDRFKFVSSNGELGCNLIFDDNLMFAKNVTVEHWQKVIMDFTKLYETPITGWIEVEL